jgi:predicted nucleic acid-binding protein
VTYVIDASVAIKWLVPEALSEEALRLLDAGEELIAPEMLMIEAANVLWRKCLQRGLTGAEADQALRLLGESGLDLRPVRPLAARALELARTLGHPVYDCVYLSLAERERATLVSADDRFLAVVTRRRLKIAVSSLAEI